MLTSLNRLCRIVCLLVVSTLAVLLLAVLFLMLEETLQALLPSIR